MHTEAIGGLGQAHPLAVVRSPGGK
jgi:hypothetical protein